MIAQGQAVNPYNNKIQVVNVHRLQGTGNLKAFATVQLGQVLEIHGVKVIQQEGQRAYVRLPDQQSNGRWYPLVKPLDERFQAAVSDAVLAAWGGEQ